MTLTMLRRLSAFAPVLVALTIVIGGATPASAGANCGEDLASCYGRAAGLDSVWSRMAYALDCDEAYVQCILPLEWF